MKEIKELGKTINTSNGSTLTVTGDNGLTKNKRKLLLTCSICSKDKELWPEGSIQTPSSSFMKGKVSCGCSKTPRWTKEQFLIKVSRMCTTKTYFFYGWKGEWKGSRTKLILGNPETGNVWSSTNISEFLSGVGDVVSARAYVKSLRHTKALEDHVMEIMATGKFKTGTEFTRCELLCPSAGSFEFLNYTCPQCSHDHLVKEGLCSGVFTSSLSNLKMGKVSCRCGERKYYTKQQKEYLIRDILETEGSEFLGWTLHKKFNQNVKFSWKCSKGHLCSTDSKQYLVIGTRCPICAREENESNLNGYYPERFEEKDYLCILNFDNQYIKVGRSFKVPERIKQLRNDSGIGTIFLLKSFTATHQEVYDAEQWVHEELEDRGFYHHESDWSTETFHTDSEDLTYHLLKETHLKEVI